MHAVFCTCKTTCIGIPGLEDLVDEPYQPHADRCIYANESVWALTGINFGFRAITSYLNPVLVDNYENKPQVDKVIGDDITAEYKNGWLRLLSWTRYSFPMFGKDESQRDNDGNYREQYRNIKDFSTPKHDSLNDRATYNRISYMTIRSAVTYMTSYCYFSLVDISAAFRTLPLHPTSARYTIYRWFGRIFQDVRLPWGLRPSSEFFCRLSALVRLILLAQGFVGILVYCDDFFTVNETLDEATRTFDALKNLLLDLGFTWKVHKCIAPRQWMKWLGFMFYSNYDGLGGMKITMDPEKLEKLRNMLRTVIRTKRASLKSLQKICGLCVHLTQTVFGARIYYKQIINLIRILKAGGQLSRSQLKNFILDATYWLHEVQDHDGTQILCDQPAIRSTYMATDAALQYGVIIGIGYFIDGHYLSITGATIIAFLTELHKRANDLQKKHKKNFPFNKRNTNSKTIAYLELFALWWMLSSDPDKYAGKYLPVRMDNTNAIQWILKGSAPIPYLPILKPLLSLMRTNRIRLYPIWIPSKANKLADWASRGKIKEIIQQLPNWKAETDTSLTCPLPDYTKPGPLFLWTHGYYGQEIPDASMTPMADLIDEDLGFETDFHG